MAQPTKLSSQWGAFNFTVLKARSPTIEGASFREWCVACTLKNTFVDFDRVGILLIFTSDQNRHSFLVAA